MKIAVSSVGQNPTDAIDPRLGRAASFQVYNTETEEWTVLKNEQNANAVQGAGIQAAELLARSGASVVLTGHCGPKAFKTLKTAGVQVCVGAEGTVQDSLRHYLDGSLQPSTNADVEGHW